jgi:hypothetical protein
MLAITSEVCQQSIAKKSRQVVAAMGETFFGGVYEVFEEKTGVRMKSVFEIALMGIPFKAGQKQYRYGVTS